MIYPKRIVPKLNRCYNGHFQNTPNVKTFFGYAVRLYSWQKNRLFNLKMSFRHLFKTVLWAFALWLIFFQVPFTKKKSWFEMTIVLIIIVNGTAKEPLRCVVILFSFDFICWHFISMSSKPVELSCVRFPAKLSRAVSVSRKQLKTSKVDRWFGLTGNRDCNQKKGRSFIAMEPRLGCNADCFDYERNVMFSFLQPFVSLIKWHDWWSYQILGIFYSFGYI